MQKLPKIENGGHGDDTPEDGWLEANPRKTGGLAKYHNSRAGFPESDLLLAISSGETPRMEVRIEVNDEVDDGHDFDFVIVAIRALQGQPVPSSPSPRYRERDPHSRSLLTIASHIIEESPMRRLRLPRQG